ncbi:MAG: adenosylmethionine decarboxylase [Chloroflexi bacterium]|nr:adenosylmethionine decarboxylase [Chloroflexota bacterium]
MNAVGTHVLLDLKKCNRASLNDLPFLREALLEAAEKVGATIIDHTFHQFSPQGVTGVVAIAESHLCIHTWPELGYAAVDIFTCGESFDPMKAARLIIERLESKEPSAIQLKRGLMAQPAIGAHHG